MVDDASQLCALGTEGDSVRQLKEALLTFFEVMSYGALLLVLPGALVGLFFDWMAIEILTGVIVMTVAGTIVLTAIAIHEGWYFDHLSRWARARNRAEPNFNAQAASGHAPDRREDRSGQP